MRLVGYADALSVEPGSAIEFMVSSEAPAFRAEVVRLIHGDTNPAGPGYKAESVPSAVDGEHAGIVQELRAGSYIRIPAASAPRLLGSFTLHLWVLPTLPAAGPQALVAHGGGYALRLEDGRLHLQVGSDPAAVVALDQPMQRHAWHRVVASFDAASGSASLLQEPLDPGCADQVATVRRRLDGAASRPSGDLLIAAEGDPGEDATVVRSHFNGKIDAPRLFGRAIDEADIAALRAPDADVSGLVAAWDLSRDITTSAVTDVVGDHHGATVNKPTRAVTGHDWDGSETAWPHAPEQYGAIHFHDDDLDDAGWSPSVRWEVPDDLPSGVYALCLEAGRDEDHIPFAVRPRRGTATADVVFLMPTFSYLAYGNEHVGATVGQAMVDAGIAGAALAAYPATPQDRYVVDNRLNSLYDAHTDGSGVVYSSRLRPIVNMRPKLDYAMLNAGEGSPHQFNADLHLVDWLHETGHAFDVVTDEDLHREGAALLEGYRVVVTGTHCEYWSQQMIRAAQRYLLDGGRLMYLGGNGMYWVTQHDPEHGNGIEVRRRGPSTRVFEPAPGEAHLAATGELGGIWRYRGISPQSWLGIGFTAQGIGEGRPYDRLAGSFDDAVAWIFDGLADDARIGDFPSLVNGYGAAGVEIDRLDHDLGTPLRTHHLASATGFTDAYQHAIDEVLMADSAQGGSVNPKVRADMVLLEYPRGGAVFAPGSISWCAGLSHNGYRNSVARVTRNVLEGFLRNQLPGPRAARLI